jgi:EmrB/QacA subfamily drug resistance transporter
MTSNTRQPQTTATTDGTEYSRRRWLALAVIAVAQLMVVLDASVVTIALPSAQHALGISTADRQWVITAYTLAFGGLLLLGGRIADFRGRKRMFMVGLIGFAAASALGGAAQSAAMLFGARALQGGFAALMAPAALSLISVTFTEPKERATAFGVYGAIAGGGAAVGLILGGVLTQYLSWRWCLYINIPISVLAALAARRVVAESRAHGNTRYDIPGTVAVSAGLVALVYGFTKASTDGWGSPVPLLLFGLAALLLVGFVMIERRTSHPLLPMRIVLDRNRGASYIGSFLVGVAMLGTFLFMTYYFQGTLHYSALKTGFAFLPFSAGIIAGSTLASRFLPRTGPRPIMTIGFLTAAAGLAYMTLWGVHSSFPTHVLPAELLISIGMGFAFVPMSSTALIGAGEHDAGVASATLNTSQQIGGSLGTALLNTIFATAVAGAVAAHGHGPASLASAQVHGYHVGATFSAGVLAAAAVIAFALITPIRRQGAEAPISTPEAVTDQPALEVVGAD